MIRATLLAATLAVAPPVAAQPHPLVGAWKISYPGGMRMENGTPTPLIFTGVLTVELSSDSLIGTLVTDPLADLPPRPEVRIATKAGPGDVVFLQRSKARINLNGEEQEATSISTWSLHVDGDGLKGTIDRQVEGFEAMAGGPQPVSGTRVKS